MPSRGYTLVIPAKGSTGSPPEANSTVIVYSASGGLTRTSNKCLSIKSRTPLSSLLKKRPSQSIPHDVRTILARGISTSTPAEVRRHLPSCFTVSKRVASHS